MKNEGKKKKKEKRKTKKYISKNMVRTEVQGKKGLTLFKGTVSVISNDPPQKGGNVRFTTESFQAWSDPV